MAVAITAHAFWTIFQIKSSARRKKLRRAGFLALFQVLIIAYQLTPMNVNDCRQNRQFSALSSRHLCKNQGKEGCIMENSKNNLSLEQYRELYTKAFAKLADISQQAEEAMQALEELQLVMGDQ